MGRWSSSEREQSPLPKTGLEESKRGEASLKKPPPPLLLKERGIKGVRLLTNF